MSPTAPVLQVPSFAQAADAAARYWAGQLKAGVTRPGNLYQTLLDNLLSSQQPTAGPVALCSRPNDYVLPNGYNRVNLLGAVATGLKMKLSDFKSGLVIVYPNAAPRLQVHPRGHWRALMAEYALSLVVAEPLDLTQNQGQQTIEVTLTGGEVDLNDFEILWSGASN